MKQKLEQDKKLLLALTTWTYMDMLYNNGYIRHRWNGMIGLAEQLIRIVDEVVESDEYINYFTRDDNWESFTEEQNDCWDDYWLRKVEKKINKTFKN